MSKTLKSAALIVFILAFLVLAGVLMNRSARMLEHWAYPIEYEDIVKEKAKESLLAKLQRNKELVKKDGDSDKKIKQKNMER